MLVFRSNFKKVPRREWWQFLMCVGSRKRKDGMAHGSRARAALPRVPVELRRALAPRCLLRYFSLSLSRADRFPEIGRLPRVGSSVPARVRPASRQTFDQVPKYVKQVQQSHLPYHLRQVNTPSPSPHVRAILTITHIRYRQYPTPLALLALLLCIP